MIDLTLVVLHILSQRHFPRHIFVRTESIECQLRTIDILTTLRVLEKETQIEVLIAEVHTESTMPVRIRIAQYDITCGQLREAVLVENRRAVVVA